MHLFKKGAAVLAALVCTATVPAFSSSVPYKAAAADISSEKGLKESVDFENMISLEMMQTFGEAFGIAALEVVVGGSHNVVGMGGTDNNLNRKPDDKDETSYQAMKPSKKKGVTM